MRRTPRHHRANEAGETDGDATGPGPKKTAELCRSAFARMGWVPWCDIKIVHDSKLCMILFMCPIYYDSESLSRSPFCAFDRTERPHGQHFKFRLRRPRPPTLGRSARSSSPLVQQAERTR